MRIARHLVASLAAVAAVAAGTSAAASTPPNSSPDPTPAATDATEATSGSPEDQAAADAAIAAYTEFATSAGFDADGPGQQGDVLGIASSDSEEPGFDCFADITPLIDPEDGTFVGETARSTADVMVFAEASDDVDSTSTAMMIPETDRLEATVAFGDEAAVEGFASIVETMASEDLEQCLNNAMQTLASLAPEPTDGEEGFSVEFDLAPLDVADGGVTLAVTSTNSIGDTEYTFNYRSAVARVGNALAVVNYSYGAEPLAEVDVVEALQTIVDALA